MKMIVGVAYIVNNHHHTETYFIFILFVFMSWPSSSSVVFIIMNHRISLKQTRLFFGRFLENHKLVLDDNLNEKSV